MKRIEEGPHAQQPDARPAPGAIKSRVLAQAAQREVINVQTLRLLGAGGLTSALQGLVLLRDLMQNLE
jgi:hypothetical protein